ncbi:hypothetical protein WDV85_09285 [Pseudokineococcus sp. 5B2Z-1]|uniref:hypothetical protein n=1 Tax=Pseudokineococcus sp. 5B2Z-1 TaxID=3132744 RepID=UPI0030A1B56C
MARPRRDPAGGPPAGDPRAAAATSDVRPALRSGPGRLLVAVYAVFALSASARALVQIATDFSAAPLAYLLSALAAAVYVVATVALVRSSERSRRVALVSVTVELVGVLTVGLLSVEDPVAFPDATVWSGFGAGYGYVPLVLPVLGLWWLRSQRPRRAV